MSAATALTTPPCVVRSTWSPHRSGHPWRRRVDTTLSTSSIVAALFTALVPTRPRLSIVLLPLPGAEAQRAYRTGATREDRPTVSTRGTASYPLWLRACVPRCGSLSLAWCATPLPVPEPKVLVPRQAVLSLRPAPPGVCRRLAAVLRLPVWRRPRRRPDRGLACAEGGYP